jgi:transcriptional regulator with XRE-family HTH domain
VAASSLSLIESGKRVPTLDTVEKLLRYAGHSLVTIPTRRENATIIAERIAAAERAGHPDQALRHFIQLNDNLAAEHNEVRYALAITEPASTGIKHWDAALAGLVAYRLAEEGFPAPGWTVGTTRTLGRSWTVNAGRYVVPVDRAIVPKEFLERGVLVDPDTLASV